MRPLILALLGVCCLATSLVEGVGNEVPEKSICVSLTTKRLPVNRIKTYTIREGSMRAVIFITRRGLQICADPEAGWVQTAVKILNSTSKAPTKPTGTQSSTRMSGTLTG
ncbi:lymphotactin [Tupaia chinensis]|nr:lymphotactin [Tupaia chinensis]